MNTFKHLREECNVDVFMGGNHLSSATTLSKQKDVSKSLATLISSNLPRVDIIDTIYLLFLRTEMRVLEVLRYVDTLT